MGDDVQAFHFRARRDRLQEVLEMEDGELARFAVVGVAAQPAESRRPAVGDGDAGASHEMPDLRRPEDGIVERVVVAVHEDVDVLLACVRQPFAQQGVEGSLLLAQAGDHVQHGEVAPDAAVEHARQGGEFALLAERGELQPVRLLAQGAGAVLDELLPGGRRVERDTRLAERQALGPAVAVVHAGGVGLVDGAVGGVEHVGLGVPPAVGGVLVESL